jgi:peptidoglycan/LPS O-acetylase OafA/YrhL
VTATRRGRVPLVVGYTFMALAGVAAMVWPAPSVRAATDATSGVLVYLWAILLTIGGLACALGAATDRWLGEYAGLWPLVSTFAVYGIAAFSSGRGPVSYAGGFALLSISLLMYGRWQVVAVVRREAELRASRQ